MRDFEDELKAAFARKPAPAGFAERVAVRARRRPVWKSWATAWAAGGIAASVLAGVLAVQQVQASKDRERGEVARAQFLQAMRIAGVTAKRISEKVEKVNR